MPADTPRWPDELPVNMTEAEYRALAEDISRSVEIVHGHIIKCESVAPPLYLVVLLDATYDITEIREFHLDAAASTYRLHAIHRSVLDLEQPVRLTLPISELVIT